MRVGLPSGESRHPEIAADEVESVAEPGVAVVIGSGFYPGKVRFPGDWGRLARVMDLSPVGVLTTATWSACIRSKRDGPLAHGTDPTVTLSHLAHLRSTESGAGQAGGQPGVTWSIIGETVSFLQSDKMTRLS